MPTTAHDAKHLPSGPYIDLRTHEKAESIRHHCRSLERGYASIWPDYDETKWYLTEYARSRLVSNDCTGCVKSGIHKKRRQIRALEQANGLYDGHELFVIEKNGMFRLLNGHNTVAMLFLLGLPAHAIWIDAPENR